MAASVRVGARAAPELAPIRRSVFHASTDAGSLIFLGPRSDRPTRPAQCFRISWMSAAALLEWWRPRVIRRPRPLGVRVQEIVARARVRPG